MEQTVYIDLFFIINFSMDFLSLFLTSTLLGRRKSILKFVLAAIFGGVYACFSLIVPIQSYLSFFSILLDVAACFIMSLIAAFERKSCKGVFSFSIVLFAISILLGGAMTALFYAFNRLKLDMVLSGANVQGDGVSVYIFAIFAALSGGVTLFGGRFFKKRALRQGGTLKIEHCGRTVELVCMCDSGNLLCEPISHLPCVLVELDALNGVFSDRFLKSIKSGKLEKIPDSEANRVRMIPAKSATGEALFIGIRPDRIFVDMGNGAISVEAYLAISTEKISANGARALIPSELALCAV